MITGQSPRIQWRKNSGGQVRTIVEAVAIAKSNGVKIPDDVSFSIDEIGDLGPDRTACGPRVDKPASAVVYWSDLVHDRTKKVPFRVWSGVLDSDEAIVAVFAHEMHELEQLRPLLRKGSTSIDEFIAMTSPDNAGNLHDEAWDVSDGFVERMREVR